MRVFVEICKIIKLENFAVGKDMQQVCLDVVRELFRTNVAKQLSHMGAITLSMDQISLIFGPAKQAKQVVIDKIKIKSGEKDVSFYYRVSADYGNACYAGWWRNLVSNEVLYELFNCTNEEVLGDGFEMLLGFFEVIGHFQKVLPKWGNIHAYKRWLETSMMPYVIAGFPNMPFTNRKRGNVKHMNPTPAADVEKEMERIQQQGTYLHPMVRKVMEEMNKQTGGAGSGEGTGGGPVPPRTEQDDGDELIGAASEGYPKDEDMGEKGAQGSEDESRKRVEQLFRQGMEEAKRRRICLGCGTGKHSLNECSSEDKKDFAVKAFLTIFAAINNVQADDQGTENPDPSASSSTGGSRNKMPSAVPKPSRRHGSRTVAHMYDQPAFMDGMADILEGGYMKSRGEDWSFATLRRSSRGSGRSSSPRSTGSLTRTALGQRVSGMMTHGSPVEARLCAGDLRSSQIHHTPGGEHP